MRYFVVAVVTLLGLVSIGFSSVSYALAGQECPPGTQPDQNLAECASCANGDTPADGCVAPQADPAGGGSCSESSCDLIKTYVNPIVTLLSALVGVACVVSIIAAGIQYTTSAGDPQKASAAKSRITNTIIAFLAFAFLWAFLEFLIPGGVINPGS